jgi:hypothetical protein
MKEIRHGTLLAFGIPREMLQMHPPRAFCQAKSAVIPGRCARRTRWDGWCVRVAAYPPLHGMGPPVPLRRTLAKGLLSGKSRILFSLDDGPKHTAEFEIR